MSRRSSGLAVWSWALYDFSNTIFSISILSFFFPVWLATELDAGPDVFNYATAAGALLVVLTAPFLGAVADLRQRRKPFLIVLTLVAVGLTVGLEFVGTVAVAVAVFIAANYAYQSALLFYNALLPGVSVGRGAGRVSGYGVGVGYVGTILALLVLTFFVTDGATVREWLGPLGGWLESGGERNANAFLPTAVLYLVFSLPLSLFVPDVAVREPRPVSFRIAYRDVFETLKNLRRYSGVGTFILATALYTDAANTAVANMALYGRAVFDMDGGDIRNLLLFSTVFAAVGSFSFGVASDRVGPKRTLIVVLFLWVVSILIAALAVAPWMLLVAGPLVGIALGATWTVSRVMLVALSPPDKLGEFFGLYTISQKLSAVLGPVVIAVLLNVFGGFGVGISYRISIGSLIIITLLGLFFLLRVPDVRPDSTVEEFGPGDEVLDSSPSPEEDTKL
jgi:UMF1 family MFS transporter